MENRVRAREDYFDFFHGIVMVTEEGLAGQRTAH
jgi:hypothetical protein